MRLLILPLLLLLTAFTAGHQNDALTDKRWYFGYMRLNGQVMEPPVKVAPEKRPWMYFGKDGAYQQGMDGKLDNGVWILQREPIRITTTITTAKGKPEVTELKLLKVNGDSLELQDADGAILGMVSK